MRMTCPCNVLCVLLIVTCVSIAADSGAMSTEVPADIGTSSSGNESEPLVAGEDTNNETVPLVAGEETTVNTTIPLFENQDTTDNETANITGIPSAEDDMSGHNATSSLSNGTIQPSLTEMPSNETQFPSPSVTEETTLDETGGSSLNRTDTVPSNETGTPTDEVESTPPNETRSEPLFNATEETPLDESHAISLNDTDAQPSNETEIPSGEASSSPLDETTTVPLNETHFDETETTASYEAYPTPLNETVPAGSQLSNQTEVAPDESETLQFNESMTVTSNESTDVVSEGPPLNQSTTSSTNESIDGVTNGNQTISFNETYDGAFESTIEAPTEETGVLPTQAPSVNHSASANVTEIMEEWNPVTESVLFEEESEELNVTGTMPINETQTPANTTEYEIQDDQSLNETASATLNATDVLLLNETEGVSLNETAISQDNDTIHLGVTEGFAEETTQTTQIPATEYSLINETETGEWNGTEDTTQGVWVDPDEGRGDYLPPPRDGEGPIDNVTTDVPQVMFTSEPVTDVWELEQERSREISDLNGTEITSNTTSEEGILSPVHSTTEEWEVISNTTTELLEPMNATVLPVTESQIEGGLSSINETEDELSTNITFDQTTIHSTERIVTTEQTSLSEDITEQLITDDQITVAMTSEEPDENITYIEGENTTDHMTYDVTDQWTTVLPQTTQISFTDDQDELITLPQTTQSILDFTEADELIDEEDTTVTDMTTMSTKEEQPDVMVQTTTSSWEVITESDEHIDKEVTTTEEILGIESEELITEVVLESTISILASTLAESTTATTTTTPKQEISPIPTTTVKPTDTLTTTPISTAATTTTTPSVPTTTTAKIGGIVTTTMTTTATRTRGPERTTWHPQSTTLSSGLGIPVGGEGVAPEEGASTGGIPQGGESQDPGIPPSTTFTITQLSTATTTTTTTTTEPTRTEISERTTRPRRSTTPSSGEGVLGGEGVLAGEGTPPGRGDSPGVGPEEEETPAGGIPLEVYPYGSEVQDEYISCSLGSLRQCSTPRFEVSPVYLEGVKFKYMQVNSNGYVVMGAAFNKRQPSPWDHLYNDSFSVTAREEGLGILTPLWTDNDLTGPGAEVSFQQYDKNLRFGSKDRSVVSGILTQAEKDVLQYTRFSEFSPTWVLVVTWSNMFPRVLYDPDKDTGPNTYQLVLISDALNKKTVVFYYYETIGWDSESYIRPSQIGTYLISGDLERSYTSPMASTSTAFKLDQIEMIDGDAGVWVTVLSDVQSRDVDREQRCMDWYYNSYTENNINHLNTLWAQTRTCPCSLEQLEASEASWMIHRTTRKRDSSNRLCYVERLPQAEATVMCCYQSQTDGALITLRDGTSGNYLRFHPNQDTLHYEHDILPKQWCCSEESHFCDHFYILRPIDNCSGFTPPQLCWVYGDPHIRTLDDLLYTFNGLGEYHLISMPNKQFILQGRTTPALDIAGQEVQATVFSGFAAKDSNSDKVQIMLNNDRDGVEIYLDGAPITKWFYAAVDGAQKKGHMVHVIHKSATEVDVAFHSGFTMSVTFTNGMLGLVMEAPARYIGLTRGLLGLFNNDTNDDFTASDGTVVDVNSLEEVIFADFGETWRIEQSSDSIFDYLPGEDFDYYHHLLMMPIFFEDMTPTQDVIDQCEGERTCIYDATVTGVTDIGLNSLSSKQRNEGKSHVLNNRPPVLSGSSRWDVIHGVYNAYLISASDPDHDAVSIKMLTSRTDDTPVFDALTGNVEWTPKQSEPITINFQARDSHGAISPLFTPDIYFCECSGHGLCDFRTVRQQKHAKGHFQYVLCKCEAGWTGPTCSIDYNACETYPCLHGTQSTDLTPEEQADLGVAFTCENDCQEGYEPDVWDNECIDVDECSLKSPCDIVTTECINTPGSYICRCTSQYYADPSGKGCIDIDECEMGLHGCNQLCSNSIGGYTCQCVTGYILTDDDKTCIDEGQLCVQVGLTCSHGCKQDKWGMITCFCHHGYRISNDLQTCLDIDECSQGDHTCSDVCENEVGSYSCSCFDGYLLHTDQRSCVPCPEGSWGEKCSWLCNCASQSTPCHPQTGCEECPPGYITDGECKQDIDECQDHPCSPGTTCHNIAGSYQCICPEGFISLNLTHCTEVDECRSSPCFNGGDCYDTVDGYFCVCSVGYQGVHCMKDVDECLSNPCLNGGVCQNIVGEYHCECTGNWMGINCQLPVVEPGTVTPVSLPSDCVFVYVESDKKWTYNIDLLLADLPFQQDLSDPSSTNYRVFSETLTSKLNKVFGCHPLFKGILVQIHGFVYSMSSTEGIYVSCLLDLAEKKPEAELRQALVEGLGQIQSGLKIDPSYILVSGIGLTGEVPSWNKVFIALAVVASVIIVVVVLICIFLRRQHHNKDDLHPDDDIMESGPWAPFGLPYNPSGRVWSDTSSSTLSSLDKPLHSYDLSLKEEKKLKIIDKAIRNTPTIDWSILKRFADKARNLIWSPINQMNPKPFSIPRPRIRPMFPNSRSYLESNGVKRAEPRSHWRPQYEIRMGPGSTGIGGSLHLGSENAYDNLPPTILGNLNTLASSPVRSPGRRVPGLNVHRSTAQEVNLYPEVHIQSASKS